MRKHNEKRNTGFPQYIKNKTAPSKKVWSPCTGSATPPLLTWRRQCFSVLCCVRLFSLSRHKNVELFFTPTSRNNRKFCKTQKLLHSENACSKQQRTTRQCRRSATNTGAQNLHLGQRSNFNGCLLFINYVNPTYRRCYGPGNQDPLSFIHSHSIAGSKPMQYSTMEKTLTMNRRLCISLFFHCVMFIFIYRNVRVETKVQNWNSKICKSSCI